MTLRAYRGIRAATQSLCEGLSAEDCAIQSMPDASPVKWHLAHTSWFFETFVLQAHAAGYQAFEPRFRVLFNSYYNAVGDRHPRPERGMLSRPPLEAVMRYRQHVDEGMDRLLERDPAPEAGRLVELGLQHEQQHQELILTDLKHLLSRNPLEPAWHSAPAAGAGAAAPLAWRGYAGGLVHIGHQDARFCFDNEQPRHRVFLEPYRLASRLVTNGEYLEFMADGGYDRPELWLSAGWDAVQREGWRSPLYWRRQGTGWRLFNLSGSHALDPAEPACHVSQFEADAYARWAGARLPTEAEWETAAAAEPVAGNFQEDARFHPAPAAPAGEGRLAQVYGDAWEWTSSSYAPYPGYRPAAGAVGEYNGKFMSNQYVLRGGSCATPRGHVRATYRNFFPSTARWQFSGIRLAQDA